MSAREILQTFDLAHIPTLDVAVLGALELFAENPPTPLVISAERPLVLGSGNAYVAAQIIFAHQHATFGDETTYETLLGTPERFDAVIVMSASGGKHAIPMCAAAAATGLPVYLVTNNEAAPARAQVVDDHVFVYSMNREPYTYNTSTYLGPILGATKEDPSTIASHLHTHVTPRLLRNFDDYDAYTFIVPAAFSHVRAMLRTKFDELFGPYVTGRFFTPEEMKHAKTVVTSGTELFISFGCNNTQFGLPKNRLEIPLPEEPNYATAIAATYFVVGKIQAAHPPYFASSIEAYAKAASAMFGHTIHPIVE